MVRAFTTVAVCAIIIAAGVSVAVLGARFRAAEPSAEAATAGARTAVPSVKVQVLKPESLEDRLVLTGIVAPWQDVMLSSEATGRIERQNVEEGQSVKAGQELVRIDTSLNQARLDQALAQERLARQEYERIQSLSTKGISTPQAVDKSQADLDVATANVRLIQIQLSKSVVTAPFDGVLDKLLKDEGEFVDMGAPLVRLVQTRKVKVNVGIPEREVRFFALGDRTRVTLDALQGTEFEGRLYRVSPTADPATLTFSSEIEVDNADGLIKPGMVSRVSLVRQSFPDALVAPIFAVISLENQRFVFVEENGVARVRPIETGVIQGHGVQVTAGLNAQDRLIVAGQRELSDGEPVSVSEVLEP